MVFVHWILDQVALSGVIPLLSILGHHNLLSHQPFFMQEMTNEWLGARQT